jgi:AcrR family transcriptional regulator
MPATRAQRADHHMDTRRRLIDAAQSLFIVNSVAGTSLQMIADELDVTKQAIYYHFKDREELLLAVMEPFVRDLRRAVEIAETAPTASARADAMVAGYAGVMSRHRALGAVLVFDAYAVKVLSSQPKWCDLADRQIGVFAGTNPDVVAILTAHAILGGLASAATGAPVCVDDAELCIQLAELGRRLWRSDSSSESRAPLR